MQQPFLNAYPHIAPTTLEALEDITGKGFEFKYEGNTWRVGNRTFALNENEKSAISEAENKQIVQKSTKENKSFRQQRRSSFKLSMH